MKRAVLALALSLLAVPALAQLVPPGRPLTVVVGRADTPAPAERVDGSRRGLSRTPLPEGPLHVAWRRSAGPFVEHAPLVTPEGDIVVFTGRSDMVELGPDGVEKRRLVVGAGPLGPGAILADGTIVTMTTSGEAVGIQTLAQTARVRFRTRVGDRGMLALVAPLALDDGGVVVSNAERAPGNAPFASEIAALDGEGRVRSRARVPLAIVWPLLPTRGGVAGVSADGVVFVWSIGSDPVRVGSFGGGLDGGATLLDPSTLVAVVDARSVVALDLERGETSVLLTSAAGVLMGPVSVAGDASYVLEATTAGTRLVAFDGKAGVTATRVSSVPLGLEADGGLAAALAPIHTATLVDRTGRVAFAGPDGHVGVVSSSGVVELGEVVCGRGAPPLGAPGTLSQLSSGHEGHGARPSAGFAGLTPTRPGAFLVACEGGTLIEVLSGG
jgi:hypothetical protein